LIASAWDREAVELRNLATKTATGTALQVPAGQADNAALQDEMWCSPRDNKGGLPRPGAGSKRSVDYCLSSIGRENCCISGVQDRHRRKDLPSVVGAIVSSSRGSAEQPARDGGVARKAHANIEGNQRRERSAFWSLAFVDPGIVAKCPCAKVGLPGAFRHFLCRLT